MTVNDFFFLLGTILFAGGVIITFIFVASRFLEDEWPSFIFVFTKMKRLRRKRDRLEQRVKFLDNSHPIYKEIADLQEQLGKKAIDNPEGFLNE